MTNAEQTATEILPCPFCGAQADTGGLLPWVECMDCDASGPSCASEAEADAEVAWTDAHALLARFVDALNVRGNMITCDHDRLTALDAEARKLIAAAAKGVR